MKDVLKKLENDEHYYGKFGKQYYANLMKKIILPNKKIFIKFDTSKPNGNPRKVLDVSLAKKYGWKYRINLIESIQKTYKSYLNEIQ